MGICALTLEKFRVWDFPVRQLVDGAGQGLLRLHDVEAHLMISVAAPVMESMKPRARLLLACINHAHKLASWASRATVVPTLTLQSTCNQKQ